MQQCSFHLQDPETHSSYVCAHRVTETGAVKLRNVVRADIALGVARKNSLNAVLGLFEFAATSTCAAACELEDGSSH